MHIKGRQPGLITDSTTLPASCPCILSPLYSLVVTAVQLANYLGIISTFCSKLNIN